MIVRARPESTQRGRGTARLSTDEDGARELAPVVVTTRSAGHRRVVEQTEGARRKRIPGMPRERLFRWRGTISAWVLLPVSLAVAFSRPCVAEGTWPSVAVSLVAWLLLGGGVFIRLWATLYIGGRKSTTLVTTGPYAVCRHPLYWASFLIALSLAAFMVSPSILAAVIALGFAYALAVIPSEERHAIACFGDAYRAYMHKTPGLLPHWRAIERPGKIEIKVAEFLRECARDLGLIALGAGTSLLAHCRALPAWPAWFHIP
jgi:protein-S-isoprenylcysteine O-methyltransferase Ste14